MPSWTPTLPETDFPAWRRLADALAADAAAGRLAPGERLPTHRDLAHRIGLSVGTVTRAYAEAEARGLIEARVGRGSFVAGAPATPTAQVGMLDMGLNLPPAAPAAARLAETFARLARRPDLAAHLHYAPAGGMPAHREAAARWLRQTARVSEASAERVIVTSGAQQAVAAALLTVVKPGEAVIAEEATFAGLKTLARAMEWRLVPAGMDAEGITPEALERAAKESGAKAAYILPVQNPTGRVLGVARRRDIVGVARRLGIAIVEDDLYAAYAEPLGMTPLSELAPELTFHVAGLSKTLAPGLRFGMLLAPRARQDAAREALRALAFGSPTLGTLVAAQWLEDGTAEAIWLAVRAEMTERTGLARRLLGSALGASPLTVTPHLWLPMDELAAERVAGAALRSGVEVTPPRSQVLDGAPVRGLRICLGGPRDLAETERGLRLIRRALLEPEGSRDAV